MFKKSLIAAAVASLMAIGLSAAPANAWHRHHGGGVFITFGHGYGHGYHKGHKHRHCHWRHGHRKCHKHRHGGGHHH